LQNVAICTKIKRKTSFLKKKKEVKKINKIKTDEFIIDVNCQIIKCLDETGKQAHILSTKVNRQIAKCLSKYVFDKSRTTIL
jgi:hypothetical protein